MTGDAFLDRTEHRLVGAGYTIDRRDADHTMLMAHRTRIPLLLGTAPIRTVFVVATAEEVTAEGWASFRRETTSIDRRFRGWWLQSVGVVAILAGGVVTADAVAAAEADRTRVYLRGAEMPALVDLSTGRVHGHDRLVAFGLLFTAHLRKQLDLVTAA